MKNRADGPSFPEETRRQMASHGNSSELPQSKTLWKANESRRGTSATERPRPSHPSTTTTTTTTTTTKQRNFGRPPTPPPPAAKLCGDDATGQKKTNAMRAAPQINERRRRRWRGRRRHRGQCRRVVDVATGDGPA